MPHRISKVLPGRCPDCGVGRLVLRRQAERHMDTSGWFYGCSENAVTKCVGRIAAHRDSKEPMGTPADWKTRQARGRAHRAFDPLWQIGFMSRQDAYGWMQRKLRLPRDAEPHIGDLDRRQCERLVHHAGNKLRHLQRQQHVTTDEARTEDARRIG